LSKSGSVDVTLQPVNLTAGMTVAMTTPGTGLVVDAGLDDIVVQGNPGQPIAVQASGVPGNPVGMSVQASGIPGQPPVGVDLGLNNILVGGVTDQPLTVTLNPLVITLNPISLDIQLDPVKVDLGLDDINVCMSLAVTEFPRMKVHMPKKIDFGFGLLGIPLMNFSLRGDSSIITEDNPPRIFKKVHQQQAPERDSFVSSAPRDKDEPPFRVVLEE
jgi:hypothetical protein